MANAYGLAALDAVVLILNGMCNDPLEAWNMALQKYFKKDSSSFGQGCTKNTFL